MEKDYVKDCVLNCLRILKSEIETHLDTYRKEEVVHFEFYHILNMTYPVFWENRAIDPESNYFEAKKEIDMIIFDVDKKDDEPLVAIELKYDTKDNPTSEIAGTKTRVKPISIDVQKLTNAKTKKPDMIAMEIYIGQGEKIEKIKKTLQNYKDHSDKIEFVIVHPESKDLIFNDKIFDYSKNLK